MDRRSISMVLDEEEQRQRAKRAAKAIGQTMSNESIQEDGSASDVEGQAHVQPQEQPGAGAATGASAARGPPAKQASSERKSQQPAGQQQPAPAAQQQRHPPQEGGQHAQASQQQHQSQAQQQGTGMLPRRPPPLKQPTRTEAGFNPATPKAAQQPAAQDTSSITTGGAAYKASSASEGIVLEFHEALARSPDMAVAVAAIEALTSVVTRSTASTMMGLYKELKEAAASLQRCNETAISLKASCELFLRYTTRTSEIESEDFATAKRRIIKRGNHFAETSTAARQTIAKLGARFIRPGCVVMVHGFSRVALALLRACAKAGIQFSVVVTEGRPDETGLQMARQLEELKVPVTLVLDLGCSYAMEVLHVDMVLVGAEGVLESGGVINKLGSYTIAIAAREHGIPFYVAAESYKFARLYPLDQSDLPIERKAVDFGPMLPKSATLVNPSRDYTPPKYISLLFTDLGVLTPAAVSDELIQLYS